MKKIIVALTVLFCISSYAQHKETITPSVMLTGVIQKKDFKEAPYSFWFDRNYDSYTVDETTVKEIKKHLKGVTIKAFMGTWCGDSKRETPHFYKIMDAAGFDYTNLQLAAVDRTKRTPENLEEGLNVFRVPTFIFYKNGKEIGRYVEYPRETLEKDMLAILSGKPYKHSYEQ
ncbi:MAG: thioredoxin family protein [Flavobacteriaceae bacterium]|jgi:thiol-disulfide isomerase/thioredoxin